MNKEQNPEALQPAEKLRDAINRIELGFSDAIATNDLRLAAMELESLYTRVQELETLAATLNVWQQAIDAELVSAHLGVAHNDATFEGAQKAIHELICWHIAVATNPATNGGQRLTDAKPIVLPEPVVLPEPSAWMLGYQTMGGDVGWKLSFSQSGAGICQRLKGGEYEKRLYTEQQVRALLEAGGQAQAVERGEVLVTVSGFTGSGKSAIAGEIEIMCRALGLQVEWPDGDTEKNMTHADWIAALEQYMPRVRIVENNTSHASKEGGAT